MRTEAEVASVLALGQRGLGASEIAKLTGISRSTVRDWLRGRLPHVARDDTTRGCCPRCGSPEHDFASPPPTYPYLLGIYLGDGSVSLHRRSVARLRVFLDAGYPQIIEETRLAIADLLPGSKVHIAGKASRFTESEELTTTIVSAYSKTWVCWLPQHGPGMKHERAIELVDWQRDAVEKAPELFLRGLIHSDGCRFMNTGTNWRNPRYSFSNKSDDIRSIFIWACDLLGLHTTTAPRTVYVSRKADVAELDRFIGPKR